MARSDDTLALWIAILLIAFSLIVNAGIPHITGNAVKTTITEEQLNIGITLHKGLNPLTIPETLIGQPAEDVFASISEHVRMVEIGTKSFQQGKRIWLPERPRYNNEIRKYQRDHYYSNIITHKEIKIKITGTEQVIWKYE